ncbi:hypothetical protein [Lysinibacillus sp. fls2-241-R2A-57]|uniref:hypothetical protein n=1 Tax=Lysinibacillus sp. fls2-241-R2A-57 TaxID=3040292 RepID=UPI002555FBEF|nr:hypothetical protein [Lysinibacillus sp. fls2-241-R2A-57]
MNSTFSKVWAAVASLWVLYLSVLYFREVDSIENINNLLIVLSGILVTASVGIGAIAYIFLGDTGKSKVLDMVIVLIFLSFSSAVVGHLEGNFKLKKVQFLVDLFFLTTTCSFILGYYKGKLIEDKDAKVSDDEVRKKNPDYLKNRNTNIKNKNKKRR